MTDFTKQFEEHLKALRDEQLERFHDLQKACLQLGQLYLRKRSFNPPHLDIEAAAAEAIERLFLADDFETATLPELAERLKSHLNTCFWRLTHPKQVIRGETILQFEPPAKDETDELVKTEELRKVSARIQRLLLEGLSRIEHDRYHDLIVQEYDLGAWGVRYRTSGFDEGRSGRRNTALHSARNQFRDSVSEVLSERQGEGSSASGPYLQTALKVLGEEPDVVELLERLS